MWGAIIGDLSGSIYEFGQTKKIESIRPKELIDSNAFFSDDSILTVAIANAIQTDGDYEKYLRQYGKIYQNYSPSFKPYFKNSFSPGFTKWLNSDNQGNSTGNGALMRISPIGFCCSTEDEVKKNAILATIPSHNSKEAIVYSTLVALIIFYGKNGVPKSEILKKLNIKLKYNKFDKFNTTCSQTFDNCIFSAFTSNNFNESIYKILSFGGDTDTNACITGAIAESLYGITPALIKQAQNYIPHQFVEVIKKEYHIEKDIADR